MISKYVKKDFCKILSIIIKNYDKINNICLKEKNTIKITDYIEQNAKDDLTIIKDYLDFILTKKKKIIINLLFLPLIFFYFL